MKKKQLSEYKNKPEADLKRELSDFRARLNNLKMDLVQGKVKNIQEVRQVKKSIAQILTLLKK